LVPFSSNLEASLANPTKLSECLGFVIPLTDAHGNLLAICAPSLLPRIIRCRRFCRSEESQVRTVLKVLANESGLSPTMQRALHEAVRAKRLSHNDG
jgi:hypothetical protein